MAVLIREIEERDTGKFISLCTKLDEETNFMLFEPGERSQNLDLEEKKIMEIRNNSYREIFVAEIEGTLIGYIGVFGNSLKRVRHRASIVIGILEEHCGKGYGKQLFSKVENWASGLGITRLELTVMTHNKRALWLYSSVGFNVEGIRRQALLVDGRYVDEFYMSKMLDSSHRLAR